MDTRKYTVIRAQIAAQALDLCRANGIDPETASIIMDAVAGSFHQMAHEALIASMVAQETAEKLDDVEKFKEGVANADIDESN